LAPKRDEPGTFPELNPLLNPILNKNLGRWAEVYSTNPPEKRDAAVLELLRELEGAENENRNKQDANGFPELASAPLPSFRAQNPSGGAQAVRLAAGQRIACQNCGSLSRAYQLFCGNCGERLAKTADSFCIQASRTEVPFRSPVLRPESPAAGVSQKNDGAPAVISGDRLGDQPSEFPFTFVSNSRPWWQSYRPYVGAVFAMVLFGLGYLAWRNGQSAPEKLSLPQPAAASQTSSPTAPTERPGAETPASTEANVPGREVPSSVRLPGTTDTSPTTKVSEKPVGTPPEARGAEELANAQQLLNGPAGRDSSQAAEWLWKSVEKRNTEATLLLAGLYLRGDGVPKNCDQGRILLDAAADRGSKSAADMLRNLQAFGCE